MYHDPIVEEVRKHREARAAKFGFNIRKIVEDARTRQATSGHPVVNLSRKCAGKLSRGTGRKPRLSETKP